MTLRTIPFALVLAGLLAGATAQQVETEVRLTLWVDVEPGRLAATSAMIASLLRQPAHCEALTRAAKIEVLAIHDGTVELELASDHKPVGILHCATTVTTAVQPTQEQRKALHDQLAVFVDNELQAVTAERPRRLLMAQIEAEQQRWNEATSRLAAHAPAMDLLERAAALQAQRQTIATQRAEARLTLTVEASVRDRLRNTMEEQRSQRAKLEEQRRRKVDEAMAMEVKAVELRARVDQTTELLKDAKEHRGETPLAALSKQLSELQESMLAVQRDFASVQTATEEATRALDEFTRTATFALDLLPTTELLLLRTEVRMKALAEESARLDEEERDLREDRHKAALAASAAELLRIDQQVARDRLVELKSKLARIEPLRIDVLSGR